jgi:hypothetical protein
MQEATAMKVYGNFHSSIFNSLRLLSTVLIVTLVFMLQGSAFAGEQVIYNFLGGNDGIGSSDLVADQAGNSVWHVVRRRRAGWSGDGL